MSDGMTLHGSPHSLPTYRIALMRSLCRTGFTFRYVSFQRGMQLTPEFRSLSRWGQVPVLERGGRTFVQSAHLAGSRFLVGDGCRYLLLCRRRFRAP